jgi:hypothetical protein
MESYLINEGDKNIAQSVEIDGGSRNKFSFRE